MADVRIWPNADELAAQAADFIISAARDAIAARGRFTLVFTGGSTPERTYALLAQPHMAAQIDWAKCFLFWGDERFVPSGDERSNYGMAWRTLLEPIRASVPMLNIWPMPTEVRGPNQGADLYADALAQFFGLPPHADPPSFDLVLLGLGDDGHVASLFPGHPTLDVTDRWVVSSPSGTLPPSLDRITLTFPVLNAARQVLFLVSGSGKADAVQDVLEGQPLVQQRPAVGVRPTIGSVTWLLDRAAASGLSEQAYAPVV